VLPKPIALMTLAAWLGYSPGSLNHWAMKAPVYRKPPNERQASAQGLLLSKFLNDWNWSMGGAHFVEMVAA
jgi:hypothetical protein